MRMPAIAAALLLGTASAMAQNAQPSTAPSSAKPDAKPSTTTGGAVQYSEPMRRLLEAAQKLRDATHAMARQKPGEARSEAIRQTNEALLETQGAMLAIPFEIRQPAGDTPEWKKSMERLQQAADKLRAAAQTMAEQSDGTKLNAAIRQTNQALMETQQAMFDLLPETSGGTDKMSGE